MAANGAAQQLVRRYCIYASLPRVVAMHPELNDEVIEYCESILSQRRFKVAEKCGSATIPGNKFREGFQATEDEEIPMLQLLPEINMSEVFLVKKIIFRKQVISFESLLPNPSKKIPRRNNSYVKLQDGRYIKVLRMFVSSLNYEKVCVHNQKAVEV